MKWLLPLLACAAGAAAFDEELMYVAFLEVFPYKDGSRALADEPVAVISAEAARHLRLLDVPLNASALCSVGEARLLGVLMRASLGNLLLDPDRVDGDGHPFRTNPVSGKVDYVDDYRNNRLTVLQVLVAGLLVALGRAWFLLDERRAPRAEDAATEARLLGLPRLQ